ncbi:MAG: zinc dependent phospholipase C family protein [Dehalococcoidia bacterium]
MPPGGSHLKLARELAPKLAHASLTAEPGAYYLGATSPDIRALTKWDRRDTHFFDLTCFEEQHGKDGLFSAHPELADARQLDESTVAFMCGYISHLEMDETWITDIYRPCFGERSPLKGDLIANLLDRVLQHELDQRDMQERDATSEIHRQIVETAADVAVSFLERATLLRWREVTAERLSDPPDWERFSLFVSRHLRPFGVESQADIAHFLENIPDLIDQSIREVTPERIEAFQQDSRRRALDAIREYLS